MAVRQTSEQNYLGIPRRAKTILVTFTFIFTAMIAVNKEGASENTLNHSTIKENPLQLFICSYVCLIDKCNITGNKLLCELITC